MPVLGRRVISVDYSDPAQVRLRELHRDVLSILEFRKLLSVPRLEFQPAPRPDDPDEGWANREYGLIWRTAITRAERESLFRREDWQEPPDAMAYDYLFVYHRRQNWAPSPQRGPAYTVDAIISISELAGGYARYLRSLRQLTV
jgi:hypothetical protein